MSEKLGQTLEMPFVLTAVRSTLRQTAEIMNGDQGSHFTGEQYTGLLKDADVRISMDGKNRALDNIITERFWRTLKHEEVYLNEYEGPKDARRRIGQFIQDYNLRRRRQSLAYARPAEVYLGQDGTLDPVAI